MTVTAAKLEFYQGNKRTLRNTIVDRDQDPEVPLDLTGLTVKWVLSPIVGKSYEKTPVLSKTATVTNAAAGECEVTLLRADTESLEPGAYYQEWEVFDGSNEREVVTVGNVTILLNVDNP